MTTDDERAQKIAEAKARAEAARAARAGGGAAQPAASAEAPAEPPADPAPAETTVIEAAPAPAAAGGSPPAPPVAVAADAGGEDDRARRIAEAKARAEAARAARSGGTPAAEAAPALVADAAPPAAQPAAEVAPTAVAAEGAAPVSADERARRIEEAKARAAAARAGREGGAPAPAAPAAPSTSAPVPAAAAAAPAARPAAAAASTAVMAPADGWKGEATAPNRVLTARAQPGAVMRRELRSHEVRNAYTRRSLVRTSFWAALGVTMAGLALGFVNFFWPRQVTGFGGIVRIPASRVPAPGAEPARFPEGKLYLVNLEPGQGVPPEFQSVAPPSESGGILALWQKCPHLGCTVPWRGDFTFEGVRGWFRCPCHGSTYTKAGIRVFGPAPRPMDTFALTVNGDGSVEVDTSQITRGNLDNANRAVLA